MPSRDVQAEIDRMKEQDLRAKRNALALVPLLEQMAADSCAGMPESFWAEVGDATGYPGGDAGNGGILSIEFFRVKDGSNYIIPGDPEGVSIGGTDHLPERVTLMATGDWEMSGLLGTLAELLAKLIPVYMPGSSRSYPQQFTQAPAQVVDLEDPFV